MSTTPLPPLPPYFQRLDLGGYAYTGEQMQSYAQQASADLEAENKRLREALSLIHQAALSENAWCHGLSAEYVRDIARAALKGTP